MLVDQILLYYELQLAAFLKICLKTVVAALFDRNALHCIVFLILQGLLLIHVQHSCSFIYITGRQLVVKSDHKCSHVNTSI